ncbi:MAG: HAD family hydrolase [Austwickia sp.]|nr:HAD family hydrolase [Austwickia sp.]
MSTSGPAAAPVSCGFDLDLTLVDTRGRILASAVAAFAELGVEVSEEHVVPYLGVPLTVLAGGLAPAADPTAFVDRYRHHYSLKHLAPCSPMPGARTALLAVRAAGHRVVVVSAKLHRFVREALIGADLDDLVDAIHGELFAADKGPALAREHAWAYLGDHPGDVVAATAAGALAIGVATGAHDGAALRAAGAGVVLEDLHAFPDWYADRNGP